MYSSLVAAQLGLSEEQALNLALVESEGEANQYYNHIKTLDKQLAGADLERKVVPDDGDCQYHALCAALKDLGLHEDWGVMDIRVLVYQHVLSQPDNYRQFLVEDSDG